MIYFIYSFLFTKNGTCTYIVQLQITLLLNLQCNLPLTHGTSAIAEPLVFPKTVMSCRGYEIIGSGYICCHDL